MKLLACGYVAVAGRPNVGKSTLVNNLLNFPLSIVTARPQTTRHKVLGILSGPDYQVVFLDSPGIIVPKYALQRLMVKAAWSAVEEADLVLLMTEPSAKEFEDEHVILDRLKKMNKTVVLVINKIDLIDKPRLLPLTESYCKIFPFREVVPVSALRKDGLDDLKAVITSNLPQQPPLFPPGELTDRPQRFFVSEIIRQKVFEYFGEEIPYSVAVVIDEYVERESGKDYIKATVVCERQSQKGMLVGKGGRAIKRFGQAARADIEAFVGKGVFLEIKVDVAKNWRRTEKTAQELGQA